MLKKEFWQGKVRKLIFCQEFSSSFLNIETEKNKNVTEVRTEIKWTDVKRDHVTSSHLPWFIALHYSALMTRRHWTTWIQTSGNIHTWLKTHFHAHGFVVLFVHRKHYFSWSSFLSIAVENKCIDYGINDDICQVWSNNYCTDSFFPPCTGKTN